MSGRSWTEFRLRQILPDNRELCLRIANSASVPAHPIKLQFIGPHVLEEGTMRKLILTLAVVCSFGIAGAVAQSSTAQSDQQPSQSTTTSTQTSTTNQNSTS